MNATSDNQFVVRASGGFRFRTSGNLTTGCDLPAGSGVFRCTSSRFTKEDVRSLDQDGVLTRLRSIPIHSWSYTTQPGVKHIGPFAEDFHAAFGLGVDDASIGLLDIAGVSLAAVQAIDARTQDLPAEFGRLSQDVARLTRDNATLQAELAALRRLFEEFGRRPR